MEGSTHEIIKRLTKRLPNSTPTSGKTEAHKGKEKVKEGHGPTPETGHTAGTGGDGGEHWMVTEEKVKGNFRELIDDVIYR
jgi:hypothetical protein